MDTQVSKEQGSKVARKHGKSTLYGHSKFKTHTHLSCSHL